MKIVTKITNEERVELSGLLSTMAMIHRGQLRLDSGLPYSTHPIDVFRRLHDWGVRDFATLKASLYHDVREDCPWYTINLIIEDIGEDAFEIVDELTFIPKEKSHLKKNEQKEIYMANVGKRLIQTLVVKVADRICNVWDFYSCGNKYCGKYLHKADKLIAHMHERKEEIDQFGPLVYTKMVEDLEKLNDVICK